MVLSGRWAPGSGRGEKGCALRTRPVAREGAGQGARPPPSARVLGELCPPKGGRWTRPGGLDALFSDGVWAPRRPKRQEGAVEELTRPFCLWPAGKSMVSEPKDQVQKTEAGGRRFRLAAKEKRDASH